MILLSPFCSNTLQLTGTTTAHGTWTVSEWVCLWVSWPPTSTSGQGTSAITPPPPLFLWEGSSGAQLRWSLQNDSAGAGNHLPRDATSRLSIKNMHYLYLWTCQCQPKRQIRKCHGSSHYPALCSPNSETKVRLMKMFSRVFLHLFSKKAEKPKKPSALLIIY